MFHLKLPKMYFSSYICFKNHLHHRFLISPTLFTYLQVPTHYKCVSVDVLHMLLNTDSTLMGNKSPKETFAVAVWALKDSWLRIFLQWSVISLQQVDLPTQRSRLEVRANGRVRQGGERERVREDGRGIQTGTHKC